MNLRPALALLLLAGCAVPPTTTSRSPEPPPGARLVVRVAGAPVTALALSPDRQAIAYVQAGAGEPGHLHVAVLGGADREIGTTFQDVSSLR
jgi:uncharacterized lipoprotein YajG